MAGAVVEPADGRRVAVLMLAAHILSMVGFSTYPALLPELRELWRLTNSEAGLIGGAFFAGYVSSVAYWTALTDRLDGRRVYLVGCVLTGVALLGFGAWARGLVAAMCFQALLGIGIAATYMPGLRLLSDRASGAAQSRYIAFYTSFFGIGSALSLAVAGALAPAFGWQVTFAASALGPVLAGAIVLHGLAPSAPRGARQAFSFATLFPLVAWRRVLAHRAAAGYTLGYAVHCLELFGSRGWVVAFLAYAVAQQPAGESFPWNVAAVAAVVSVLAVPASILGNEVALRVGRRPWILTVMVASGASGIALGAAAHWHWIPLFAVLTVYMMLVMAESATLTAGLVAAAPAELRGAAMGLYSLIGFGGGMLGPVVFGAALDAAGGAREAAAWPIGFAAIGAGCLLAPIVARVFGAGRAA